MSMKSLAQIIVDYITAMRIAGYVAYEIFRQVDYTDHTSLRKSRQVKHLLMTQKL